MYTNIGDKIIALAKIGYATNNVDKNLMKGIADWARANTSGWTLSATDPKTGTVDPNWSPNQEDWTDVYDFAKSRNNTQLMDYLTQSGYYFKQAPVQNVTPETPQGASSVNSGMQASQALNTQQQKAEGTWNYAPVGQTPDYVSPVSIPADVTVVSPAETVDTSQGSSYDPVAVANQTAADYTAMALRAGNTKLQAQLAQANWTINNGGIWKTLQPIAQQQMQDALATLEKTSAIAKANVEASRAAMNAEEAANYDEVIRTIDTNLKASRQRTTEEMNQRGLFFSTVLDSVMGKVEAASATERGRAATQHSLTLAKIAAQMAELSGNIDIETIKGNAAAVAQYTATMLQVVAQDEQTKQAAQALIAGLEVEQKGLADTIGMEIFGTVQQIQAQGRQEATAQTEQAKKDFVDTIQQYSGDFQAAINNLDPNDPLYAFKKSKLMEARTAKLGTELEKFKAEATQYAGDYQAAINALNPSDPLYADKKAILTSLRLEKIAQIAKTNAAQAQQQLENAFKERQINLQEYQAMTARINALGGGGSGTSGTTSKPAWTNAQARSFKAEYEKVMNMPIGTTIDSSVAGALAGSGVNLNVGDTWTPESRDAYLKQNKSLYNSAINFINTNDTSLWNPNNPQLSTTFRAMLQGMIGNGIMITEDNILRQIEAQGDYITPSGTPAGAEYEFLLAEFERLRNK